MSVVVREDFNLVSVHEERRIVFDVPLGAVVADPDAISFPGATPSIETVRGITVPAGGHMVAFGDARADASSGSIISSGQTVSGGTVGPGQTQTVLSGGVDIGTAIQGNQFVYGTASGVFVTGGTTSSGVGYTGVETVYSGGRTMATTVGAGSEEIVSSGGKASGTVVSDGNTVVGEVGGALVVSSGGIASGTVVVSSVEFGGFNLAGEYVDAGGEEIGGTVGAGGSEYVSGTAIGVTVSSGGHLYVASGGNAGGVTVLSGGEIELDGGTVSGLRLEAGAIEIVPVVEPGQTISGSLVSGQGQTVLAGGRAIGTTVISGIQDVDGAAIGTNVSSGGLQVVWSGGRVQATTVDAGGAFHIYSGGSASSVTVLSGGTVILDGGTFTGLVLSSGAIEEAPLVNSGQTVSGTVVPQNDSQTIDAGGLAIATQIASGGNQFVYGSAIGTVLSGEALLSGNILLHAVQYVLEGGGASGTEVGNLGQVYVDSGAQADGTTISSGGAAFAGTVTFGGTMTRTTVAGGKLYVASGALASATLISDGGAEYLSSGGIAATTTVVSGGTLISIYGAVSKLTVSSGGNAYQFAGTMKGATLAGGHLDVLGGTATGITVSSGGIEFAGTFFNGSSGGTLIGSVVNSGGVLVTGVHGTVSGAVVSAGAYLFELAGTTRGVVLSGGVQLVGGGLPGVPPPNPAPPAIAAGTIVSSGGKEYVNSNGSAVGATVRAGGEIVFNGGSISGLAVSSGGAIDLAQFAYSGAASLSFAENSQNTGGVLTVSNGTGSFAVTLLGQYAAAGFHMARDGGGGTVITYAPPTSALMLAAGH